MDCNQIITDMNGDVHTFLLRSGQRFQAQERFVRGKLLFELSFLRHISPNQENRSINSHEPRARPAAAH